MQLASGFGDRLPNEPDAAALEAFLARRRKADPEKFPDVSLAVVKLIGRGKYALDLPGGEPPGHFGLAVKDYTHSTVPNRRFPDLITQRLLKAALAGAPLPYATPELAELAKHCTEQTHLRPRLYVSFPLALAVAIGLNPGDEVQWELLDRSELHLVRLEPPPPTTKRRAHPKGTVGRL